METTTMTTMTTISLDLPAARRLRDALTNLLRQEQAAMAKFLVALADFDRRRAWELLGHASLFAFLNSELGLSPAPTFWRMSAARLLQRFPELVEPLRAGRLCLTTMAELDKVLTEENREEVLPRFLGISSREAKELVAELMPREAPPLRTVVTPVERSMVVGSPAVAQASLQSAAVPVHGPDHGPAADSLWAPKAEDAHPVRIAATRDEVEPLTADLRRLHVTVGRKFLKKLDAARDGLSHSIAGASVEQVLEAALDLLLEKQAKARGQVKKPRSTVAAATPVRAASPAAAVAPQLEAPPLALVPTEPPPPRRIGPREAIPAAVKRAVWERDHGRCAWLIDGGGTCGSTHRLEFDHVVPWARDGAPTVDGIRILCRRHNVLAARQAFGAQCVGRYART